MQLHFTTVQREGDLRFDMVRTRENAGTALHDQTHVLLLVQCVSQGQSSTLPQRC